MSRECASLSLFVILYSENIQQAHSDPLGTLSSFFPDVKDPLTSLNGVWKNF